jgi:hypothetical protein
VLHPAELGALAAPAAGTVGLQPEKIGPAGDHIHLPLQPGNPERVNHVSRSEMQPDPPAYRQMELVRRAHHLARRGVEVAHLPPPLVTGDLDSERSRVILPGVDGVQSVEAEQKDSGQHNDGKEHAAADHPAGTESFASGQRVFEASAAGLDIGVFPSRVGGAVGFGRQLARPAAQERHQQERDYSQRDRRAGPEHQLPEPVDFRRTRPGGVQCRLRGHRRCLGQQSRDHRACRLASSALIRRKFIVITLPLLGKTFHSGPPLR